VTPIEVRGDELVTMSWDLTTRRWAFPSGHPLGVIRRFDHIEDGVAIAPDAPLLATAGRDAAVELWDMTRGGLIDRLATLEEVGAVAFIGADRVVAGGGSGHLEVFALATPRPTDEILRRAAASPRWVLDHGRAVER
jgi:WD40 repeat protein